MEDIIRARHGTTAALQRTHITYIELNLVRHIGVFGLVLMTHIVLLLLIAGEDTYLRNVSTQKAIQHRISKRTGTTGNHQRFS